MSTFCIFTFFFITEKYIYIYIYIYIYETLLCLEMGIMFLNILKCHHEFLYSLFELGAFYICVQHTFFFIFFFLFFFQAI
jgi:hypothetical protein